MNKETLRAAVLAAIETELARQTHAALDAREESISEESRPESKYDTHAQEAAYLAEGQARLAADLAAALGAWRALRFPETGHTRAQLGSLVTLTRGAREELLLLGPAHGGLVLPSPADPARDITIVTPSSPLGRALLGNPAGHSLPPARRGAPPARITALD
jgi:transcription elongation GreA/GreB family factor